MAVELRDDYPVVNALDVRLSVSIGEGQTGLVSVFLGGTRISRSPAPIDLRVGNGSDVRDKLLEVRTIVNDINNQTNKMSVTYQLTGGVLPLECISKGEVARENEPLDYNAGLLQTVAQTFAVSIATTPLSGGAVVGGTRVGAGFRTLLRAGRAHPQLAAAHAELISVDIRIAEASDAIPPLRQQAFDARRAGRIAEADELDNKVAAAEAEAARQTAALRQQATEVARRVGDLDRSRVGFQLALAGAHVWDFPSDRFEQREPAQWGIWITPAYRVSTIDIMAAVRYLADQRGDGDERTWDVGGRLLWQPSPELAVSFETLRRGGTAFSGGDSSNRTVGMLEYRVNEGIVLYGSFGKDFLDQPGARTLVSIVGVNLGFGRAPIVDVAKP